MYVNYGKFGYICFLSHKNVTMLFFVEQNVLMEWFLVNGLLSSLYFIYCDLLGVAFVGLVSNEPYINQLY